jgi:hypothetical protein
MDRREKQMAAAKKSVELYLAGLSGEPAVVAKALRAVLLGQQPPLAEEIRWGQPVYSAAGGPVCYFRGNRAHVTFGFWRGVDLMDLSPRLESGGDRMAHMKLASTADIDAAEIGRLVAAAMALNEAEGSPAKRRA